MKVIGRILGLSWVVAFGGFIIFNFLPNEKKSDLAIAYVEKFDAFLQWFLSSQLFFLFFIAMWIFVSFKLGKDSGWKNLANYFAENYVGPINSKFALGSGYIGNVRHSRILLTSADKTGVYIKVIFPFSFGHKPLQIPWSAISHLREEPALVSNKTPELIKTLTTSFTSKKYMNIKLQDYPDQNIVIYWKDDFNQFVPATVLRES